VLITAVAKSPTGFRGQDVLVKVDSQPFQPAAALSPASAMPLDVILVIDCSPSASRSPLWRSEMQAIPEFLSSLSRSTSQLRVGVVEFAERPALLQPLTADRAAAISALQQLSPVHGGTALYDGMVNAVTGLQQSKRSATRRVIVVLSDGDDNQSHSSREAVIAAAQRESVVIFGILPQPQNVGRGAGIMNDLTAETGGTLFSPPGSKDMGRMFESLASELGLQYFAKLPLPSSQKAIHRLEWKSAVKSMEIHGASAVVTPVAAQP